MYRGFHPPKYISEQVGVSRSSVDKILRRRGISRTIKTPDAAAQTHRRCTCCNEVKSINEFGHSGQRKHLTKQSICKECINKQRRQYRQDNLTKYQTYESHWAREQRKKDPQYKFAQNLRRRIRETIKSKHSGSMELLGCSILDFLKYLESKFTPQMNWENYGKYGWHVDHIKPCASFDLTTAEGQRHCFHYTNLQPLWWKDNLVKGDKVLQSIAPSRG